MTGIFQTESEYLARVVMQAIQDLGHDVRFHYHDGWYELWVCSPVTRSQVSAINLAARAIERVIGWTFVPRPLGDFEEVTPS